MLLVLQGFSLHSDAVSTALDCCDCLDLSILLYLPLFFVCPCEAHMILVC